MRYLATLFVLVFVPTISTADEPELPISKADQIRIEKSFGQMPLYFIENQGQICDEVSYYIKGIDKTLFFTSTGITFALIENGSESKASSLFEFSNEKQDAIDREKNSRWIVKLNFIDANPDVKPIGKEIQGTVFSYFKGNEGNWKTGIPSYSRIIYPELWDGIDLVYTGTLNKLKCEFIVKPGADPEKIRLAYEGATNVLITEAGMLNVITPVGGFEDKKPYAYQVVDGIEEETQVSYSLKRDSNHNIYSYGFDLGVYDPNKPLFLDPVILIYCGYIGGLNDEKGEESIALDKFGNAYVTGWTNSDEKTFPDVVGPDLTYNGIAHTDVFVAKINVTGTQLVYCGYIGGCDRDRGYGIAVDNNGNAYVTGWTESDESSFPVKIGPSIVHKGYNDVFVAKVNAQGTALEYCGYIGGEGGEVAQGIAVDSQNNVYVVGHTSSNELSFPVKMGPSLIYNGLCDAFVAKVNASGAQLDYCGYIGGDDSDYARSIAVDDQGANYIVGVTDSDESSFPVKIGPDLTHNGEHDVFVAKVDCVSAQIDYCGYIGGTQGDHGTDIAVDKQGCAYVTGLVNSDESSFPVKVGPDLSYNGGCDVFVAKLNSYGTQLKYCGYIGGYDADVGYGIAVDNLENAYVTGRAESRETSFPVFEGPDLSHNGGHGHSCDAFVAKVNSFGTRLNYCGYIGGKGDDEASDIAVDASGNAYVVGHTNSDQKSFPVIAGPDLEQNGLYDVFVAKVISRGLSSDTNALSAMFGGIVNFNLFAGKENATRRYLLLGSMHGVEPGIPLPGNKVVLPLNYDSYLFSLIMLMKNTVVFWDFMGVLDSEGEGTAQLNTTNIGMIPAIFLWKYINFAYVLYDQWDYASNPVAIYIIP